MRDTIIFLIAIRIFVSSAGCYKSVLIRHDEEKWWEKGQAWIKTNESEKWIKAKEVKADSVYGEMDMGLSTPAYKKVVVPLDKIERVKRMKMDPVSSAFGIALLAGTVFGVVYTVSFSNLSHGAF